MSEDDADALGICQDRKTRSAYVRLDDGKQNYAAISEARWFEKVVHVLASGEHVPAVVPWTAPDVWDAVSPIVANHILDDIDAGPREGQRYSHAPNAGHEKAAWRVVTAHVASLTKTQARAIIKTWVNNEVLLVREYRDAEARKDSKGLFVNPANRPGAR